MTVKGYKSNLEDVDRGEILTSRGFALSNLISADLWRICKIPPSTPPRPGAVCPRTPEDISRRVMKGIRTIIRLHKNNANDPNGDRPLDG